MTDSPDADHGAPFTVTPDAPRRRKRHVKIKPRTYPTTTFASNNGDDRRGLDMDAPPPAAPTPQTVQAGHAVSKATAGVQADETPAENLAPMIAAQAALGVAKRDLINRVSAEAGLKRPDARRLVEAELARITPAPTADDRSETQVASDDRVEAASGGAVTAATAQEAPQTAGLPDLPAATNPDMSSQADDPVSEISPDTAMSGMGKRELITRVAARSGLKRRDAKRAVEAVLAVLGEALSDGRELNLHPMGKLRIIKVKQGESSQVLHARLRQANPVEKPAQDPLAQAAE